jgi:hypothetical protein
MWQGHPQLVSRNLPLQINIQIVYKHTMLTVNGVLKGLWKKKEIPNLKQFILY